MHAVRTGHVTARTDRSGASWRLPAHHVMDLRDAACGVEETNAGICTRYLLDELERAGPPPEGDIALFEAESFVDQYVMNTLALERLFGAVVVDWRAKMRRCRLALAALVEQGDRLAHDVLHVVYGHPDPATRVLPKKALDFFGSELAPLVRYTDATEVVRRELVRDLVPAQRALAHSPGNLFALRNCETFEAPQKDIVDLSGHRAAEAYLDAVLTSSDALRHALDDRDDAPKLAPGEDKAEHELRCAAWHARVARKAAFLVKARDEADRMLTAASRAYQDAWKACPRPSRSGARHW